MIYNNYYDKVCSPKVTCHHISKYSSMNCTYMKKKKNCLKISITATSRIHNRFTFTPKIARPILHVPHLHFANVFMYVFLNCQTPNMCSNVGSDHFRHTYLEGTKSDMSESYHEHLFFTIATNYQ